MNTIEITGSKFLKGKENEIANKLFSEYYEKIKRLLKNEFSLKALVKEHKKEGTKRKLTFDVEVIFPGRTFKAKAFDWDSARAIHKVMNKIVNEIEHKFHASEQNK